MLEKILILGQKLLEKYIKVSKDLLRLPAMKYLALFPAWLVLTILILPMYIAYMLLLLVFATKIDGVSISKCKEWFMEGYNEQMDELKNEGLI